jgi:hypothetical protein
MTANAGIAEAPVFKIKPSRDGLAYILYVQCPYCNKIHRHGETVILNRRYFGTRLSHCDPKDLAYEKKDYLLVRNCVVSEY